MRFINTQRYHMACGPIAIANALKFQGVKVNCREVVDFCAQHELYGVESGMRSPQMKKALNLLGINFKHGKRLKTRDLETFIDKGYGIILLYAWPWKDGDGGWSGHYIFIDDFTCKYFRAWNSCRSNSTPRRSKKRLGEEIGYSHRWQKHGYTQAFLIKKERS